MKRSWYVYVCGRPFTPASAPAGKSEKAPQRRIKEVPKAKVKAAAKPASKKRAGSDPSHAAKRKK